MGIEDMVGGTPIVRLKRFEKFCGIQGKLLAKIEKGNPAGSVKDRAALYMIRRAEESGILRRGGTLIEPTSGNTGIALCALARARGYRMIVVMPQTASMERRSLVRAYGAELVLSDGAAGMAGAVEEANRLKEEISGAVILGQFENPANAEAHFETTGPEIWEATEGKFDFFIAGVGTGGTLCGAGKYLKSQNPEIKIVAVEPSGSPVLSGGKKGEHKIQGIGAGFVPDLFQGELVDGIMGVTDGEAFTAMRNLAKAEGLLVGISSGAAAAAAVKLLRRNEGRTAVAIFPDGGERYLSIL